MVFFRYFSSRYVRLVACQYRSLNWLFWASHTRLDKWMKLLILVLASFPLLDMLWPPWWVSVISSKILYSLFFPEEMTSFKYSIMLIGYCPALEVTIRSANRGAMRIRALTRLQRLGGWRFCILYEQWYDSIKLCQIVSLHSYPIFTTRILQLPLERELIIAKTLLYQTTNT